MWLFRAHSVAPTAAGVTDEESMAGTKEAKPKFIPGIRGGIFIQV
jgi:hypothetical protein